MFNYRLLMALSAIVLITGCQTWRPFDAGQYPPTAALPETSTPGEVEVYYWDGISGTATSALKSLTTYPDNPDQVIKISSLSSPVNRGDNYGSLVRGYIIPPVTGTYTFWVSGDDQTEFWLSSSDQPDQKALAAVVTGWTALQDYSKYSSQKSATQELVAGSRYYFEIVHKEGGGADHFSVAWAGPGFSQSIISGDALASYAQPSTAGTTESPQETYRKGYAAGYLDSSEGLKYDPVFPMPDSDGDGLYDNWEVANGLDPTDPTDATSDPDNDLLAATDEFLLGTSENNPDTDGDGIPDGDEYALNMDPLDPSDAGKDFDGDGVTNLQEYVAGTDINVPDAPASDQQVLTAGFVGQYFSGMNFDTFILAKSEADIQFSVGTGSFIPEQPVDRFSARWFGTFTAPHQSGTNNYTFTIRTDDGARLYADGTPIISAWKDQGPTTYTSTMSLDASQTIDLMMEYYENGGGAVAELSIRDDSANTNLSPMEVVQSPDLSASNMVDSDSDGIPDTWELRNGLDPWTDDASGINNTQNVSNLSAYQSGLSPWTLQPVETPSSTTIDQVGSGSTTSPGGTVTLSWTAPLTRTDGSSISLSEIQSYEVLYGTAADNLSELKVVDGSQTSTEISGLSSGTWYFSVRVVDINGLKSEGSAVQSYTIP